MKHELQEIVAVVNNKGGVGKTATVQSLASGIVRLNHNLRVLVIDLDPQCNLSSLVGVRHIRIVGGSTSSSHEDAEQHRCRNFRNHYQHQREQGRRSNGRRHACNNRVISCLDKKLMISFPIKRLIIKFNVQLSKFKVNQCLTFKVQSKLWISSYKTSMSFLPSRALLTPRQETSS